MNLSCHKIPVNDDLPGVWVDSYRNYYEFREDGVFLGFNMNGKIKEVGAKGKYKVLDNSIFINFHESESCKIRPGDKEEIIFKIINNELLFLESSGQEVNRLKKVE